MRLSLSRRSKRNRIINQLRREFPDQDWRYDHKKHCWVGTKFTVRPYATSCPRFDGDDEGYIVEYYREDNHFRLTNIF